MSHRRARRSGRSFERPVPLFAPRHRSEMVNVHRADQSSSSPHTQNSLPAGSAMTQNPVGGVVMKVTIRARRPNPSLAFLCPWAGESEKLPMTVRRRSRQSCRGVHRPVSTRTLREEAMRAAVNELMSRDGVVQARGGAEEEDTDGGFAHGGWSMPYSDAPVMGTTARRDRRYLHHWRLLLRQVRCRARDGRLWRRVVVPQRLGWPGLVGRLGGALPFSNEFTRSSEATRPRQAARDARVRRTATGWNDQRLSPPLPDT
jgi:hypothetical protein